PPQWQATGDRNIWYLNEIDDVIAKDIANPISWKGMTFYPKDLGTQWHQVWHGDKMVSDVLDDLLTANVMYYVDELVKCAGGSFFLPKRWVISSGEMFAIGHSVNDAPNGFIVKEETLTCLLVSLFVENYLSVVEKNAGVCPPFTCNDHLIYSVPIIVFIDDISGNKSKQWNKHFSCYMSNGALPHEKLDQEFHVHFVATSPSASPLEVTQRVHKAIEKAFDEPIASWDCKLKEEVLLWLFGLFFAGNNPMHAELSSFIGLNSNYFCQTCKVGGTQKHKQTDTGFYGPG
ncbi:hypothetical protein J3A83DRAFT_4098845, partial [Scleroderma citrinum]